MNTVTVTRTARRYKGDYRFTSTFSALPEHSFGPYEFAEMVRDLTVSALLPPREARDLVLDAAVRGSATTPTNRSQG